MQIGAPPPLLFHLSYLQKQVGIEERWGVEGYICPCWQAAVLLLVYFSFLVFLGISCPGGGGGGVAEEQGWKDRGLGREFYLYRLMVGLWYMHM